MASPPKQLDIYGNEVEYQNVVKPGGGFKPPQAPTPTHYVHWVRAVGQRKKDGTPGVVSWGRAEAAASFEEAKARATEMVAEYKTFLAAVYPSLRRPPLIDGKQPPPLWYVTNGAQNPQTDR